MSSEILWPTKTEIWQSRFLNSSLRYLPLLNHHVTHTSCRESQTSNPWWDHWTRSSYREKLIAHKTPSKPIDTFSDFLVTSRNRENYPCKNRCILSWENVFSAECCNFWRQRLETNHRKIRKIRRSDSVVYWWNSQIQQISTRCSLARCRVLKYCSYWSYHGKSLIWSQ